MRALGLGAVLALSACGPISYFRTVSHDAASAVKQAERSGAAEKAPYELTLAREYLHKARELGGRSRFLDAVELGKRSQEHSRKAERLAKANPK